MNKNNDIDRSQCGGETASDSATKTVATYKPHYTSRYDEESWEVSVRLPGVQKSDLSMTVESEILEISAMRGAQRQEGWQPLGDYTLERRYQLRLDVGPEVNPAGIVAALNDGILTLRLPLKEELKPLSIEVM